VNGFACALATAALLTFGATCAFAAESGTDAPKDAAAKTAVTKTEATAKAATKADAKTKAAAKTASVTAAKPVAGATGSAVSKPEAKPKAQAKAVAKAKAPAKKSATTKTVKKKKKKASVRTASAAGGKKVARAQPQENRVTYHYNALGRRDPFKPMVDGFIGADEGGQAPPDVGGLRVVGIVWGASDKFALVEDPRGNSMVLRRGDKVMNGVVEGLKRESMIVKITVDGQSQSVEIPLMRKGDDHDNQ
jgi:hypothetical protein